MITEQQKDTKEMIAEVDDDLNGKVEFEEFCEMMADQFQMNGVSESETKLNKDAKKKNPRELETIILTEFEKFDKTKNNKITVEDLKKALKSLKCSFTEKELNDMLFEAGCDEGEDIEYKEFISILIEHI